MHKLKAAAHSHAWYAEENETNLNPFGKLRNRKNGKGKNDDGETGLTHIRTEGDALDSATEERKLTFGAGSHPTHSSTMPVNHASGSRSGEAAHKSDDIAIDERKEASEESNPTSETLTQEPTDITGDKDPEKHHAQNKFMAKMPWKKHGKKDDLGKVDSKTSKSHKKKRHYTIGGQIRATIFGSWINLLLVAVPVGIALNYVHSVSGIVVFVVNFIAIIPLAGLLSYATEEIALRTGETIGGLLNATFGNAVELIVSIIALFADEIVIVQTSLIGSMLSNLLLVLGMCFFFGGVNRIEQNFNVTVAQTAASLLSLAIGSLIIPTVFNQLVTTDKSQSQSSNSTSSSNDSSQDIYDDHKSEHITAISRGTCVLLLLVYGAYLFFQLKSHAEIYNAPSEKVPKRTKKVEKGEATKGMMQGAAAASTGGVNQDMQQNMARTNSADEDDDDEEEPQLSLIGALVALLLSTVLVALCAEFMVHGIDAVTEGTGLNKTFVGLILIPIVGNAAEHATAVTVAIKDKMDLAIGVAVGSSMQIALLVLPLMVIIGWIAHKDDMDLSFDGFQIAVLFVAILLVNYLIADGKSHWLEGIQLMVLYLIIAVAAFFYPTTVSPNEAAGAQPHAS